MSRFKMGFFIAWVYQQQELSIYNTIFNIKLKLKLKFPMIPITAIYE